VSVPLLRVALLLFGSGACALVYQVVWLREFRLVFGASTAASAAVLAIFIGGLGAGGLVLGPRADRRRRPLLFYARLEMLIALSAAATPLLLALVRAAYVGLGGTPVLGLAGGTALRLLLSALVLAAPTLLMGGTLPAAARAAQSDADARRRALAILYGANTLGAVLGSFLATFVLLERLGNRGTLWLACGVNFAVALIARALARAPSGEAAAAEARAAPERAPQAPAGLVLAAAFVVGFAFFLMEMVWYRMLGPLLGGSVFTFGLILSMALLGIGLGGIFHAFFREDREATLRGFAATCLLEAACLGGAYALGDRLAILTLLLRPLGSLSFWGHVLGWTGVCAVVVVPAAFVAGVQFPLLVALLGRGRTALGRQIGQAYAWNTAGAILGSLAGGFGLLPFLGAPGCWLLCVFLLVALGLVAAALAFRNDARPAPLLLPAALALASLWFAQASGPSAAWRHSGIGAGRASAAGLVSRNGLRDFLNQEQRVRFWETEGIESSVALVRRLGMAFTVNGKIDGHFTIDAPTQVMSGLLAAALHERPRTALVIGLGTGSTAGWLGAIPGMERVDVVELERGTLQVARYARAVNRDVLENPKVRIQIGDAREVLLTTRQRYDVVFSEPSNPYRAGIASLFTREFYRAVAERLNDDGIFVQWVQSYEVSSDTVRTVFATLGEVFPEIETWRTHRDLLLLATRRPIVHRAGALRERLAQEPYRTGLLASWRVADLEGFLGYHVARPELARELQRAFAGRLNSDDANRLEFGFARAVGTRGLFELSDILELAKARGLDRAQVLGGVDEGRVLDERRRLYGANNEWALLGPEERTRATAYAHYQNGDLPAAAQTWRAQPRPPASFTEISLMAEGLAAAGDEAALPFIGALRALQPVEADAVLGQLRLRQGRAPEALQALLLALGGYRSDPWPRYELMLRALAASRELAFQNPQQQPVVLAQLARPFAGYALDEERQFYAFDVAGTLVPECAQALAAFEPWVPWRKAFLERRASCYEAAGDPRAATARAELSAFASDEGERFAPSSTTR
jgi:predicted membrane-bound spermidine synthase